MKDFDEMKREREREIEEVRYKAIEEMLHTSLINQGHMKREEFDDYDQYTYLLENATFTVKLKGKGYAVRYDNGVVYTNDYRGYTGQPEKIADEIEKEIESRFEDFLIKHVG